MQGYLTCSTIIYNGNWVCGREEVSICLHFYCQNSAFLTKYSVCLLHCSSTTKICLIVLNNHTLPHFKILYGDKTMPQIPLDKGVGVSSKYEQQREKAYRWIYAPIDDSDQSAHPHSLIRVFVVRVKKLCVLGYPKCSQWRFWSDCADAQVDLNLRWVYMSEGTFSHLEAPILLFSFLTKHK